MPDPRHEPEILLNNILAEMRGATAQIDQRDGATRARLATLEGSVNDLLRKQGRPSGGNGSPETDARSQAIELLEQKHFKGASSDCLAYAFGGCGVCRRCARLYRFHPNNRSSKCEVAHTSLPQAWHKSAQGHKNRG